MIPAAICRTNPKRLMDSKKIEVHVVNRERVIVFNFRLVSSPTIENFYIHTPRCIEKGESAMFGNG